MVAAALFFHVDFNIESLVDRVGWYPRQEEQWQHVTDNEHGIDAVHRQLRQEVHLGRLRESERKEHHVECPRRLRRGAQVGHGDGRVDAAAETRDKSEPEDLVIIEHDHAQRVGGDGDQRGYSGQRPAIDLRNDERRQYGTQ